MAADFSRLLEAEIPKVRRYARALTKNAHAADDLAQDCLTRAFAKQHLWQEGTDLKAWLFTILHNQYVNEVRVAIRHGISTPIENQLSLSVKERASSVLERRDLERALKKLPEEQRQVIMLVGLEGMSYDEVADIVGVPVGTVRSRLSRGRDTLRKFMKGTEAEIVVPAAERQADNDTHTTDAPHHTKPGWPDAVSIEVWLMRYKHGNSCSPIRGYLWNNHGIAVTPGELKKELIEIDGRIINGQLKIPPQIPPGQANGNGNASKTEIADPRKFWTDDMCRKIWNMYHVQGHNRDQIRKYLRDEHGRFLSDAGMQAVIIRIRLRIRKGELSLQPTPIGQVIDGVSANVAAMTANGNGQQDIIETLSPLPAQSVTRKPPARAPSA